MSFARASWQQTVSPRFVKFLVVSGVAAIANIGSRILFSTWMAYVPAILLAFCVGLCTAFVLNRAFVFKHAVNPLAHQAFWFTMVNLAAVLQTIAVSLLLARWAFPMLGFHGHDETVAHVIGVGVPVVTSFIGHKHFSFPVARGDRS